MSTKLPPCVRAILKSEELYENHKEIVASFFKSYVDDPTQAFKIIDDSDKAFEIYKAMNDTATPIFSCDYVRATIPEVCDIMTCPFHADSDPVKFLLNRISRAIYDMETHNLTLWFENTENPLYIDVEEAYMKPTATIAKIATYTLENFNHPVRLRKYRDKDGTIREPLDEFLRTVVPSAQKTGGSDVYGVGELVLNIVTTHTVVPDDLATVNSDVFVYVARDANRYIAIAHRLVKSMARSIIGTTSNVKLFKLLARYGIQRKRIRLKGERGYFVLVPEKVFERLTGYTIDEILKSEGEDLLSELFSVDDDSLLGGSGDNES